MIKLTSTLNNQAIFLNPAAMISLVEAERSHKRSGDLDRTYISMTNSENHTVKENPDTILNLIKEMHPMH